ncbi:MAG: hypothetical protein BGP17_00205 [Sphingomonas sp. 67-41]|nr:MAG: hypothetical protein BGP17_00205 [Sphingomonas sp. 67-41]
MIQARPMRAAEPGAGGQAGLAPAVPHFTNLPLASLQCVALAGAGFAAMGLAATGAAAAGLVAMGLAAGLVGHFMNLPCASRHGAAAIEGVAAASMASEAPAIINFLNIGTLLLVERRDCTRPRGRQFSAR